MAPKKKTIFYRKSKRYLKKLKKKNPRLNIKMIPYIGSTTTEVENFLKKIKATYPINNHMKAKSEIKKRFENLSKDYFEGVTIPKIKWPMSKVDELKYKKINDFIINEPYFGEIKKKGDGDFSQVDFSQADFNWDSFHEFKKSFYSFLDPLYLESNFKEFLDKKMESKDQDNINDLVKRSLDIVNNYLIDPRLNRNLHMALLHLDYIAKSKKFKNTKKMYVGFETIDENGSERTIFIPLPAAVKAGRFETQKIEESKFLSFPQGDDFTYYYDLNIAQELSLGSLEFTESEEGGYDGVYGEFFPYQNISQFDLSRYQIISNESQKHLLKDHCLIYAFRMGGMKEGMLDEVKKYIQNYSFEFRDLKKMCETLKINIRLRKTCFSKGKEKMQIPYPYTGDSTSLYYYNLVLYKNHYFIDEKMDVNKYEHEKEFRTGFRPRRENGQLSSFQIVKGLYEGGEKFVKNDSLFCDVEEYKIGNYSEKEYFDLSKKTIKEGSEKYQYANTKKEFEEKDKDEILENYDIFFADTEAALSDYKIHYPFMLGYSHINWDENKVVIDTVRENVQIEGKKLLSKMIGKICYMCKKDNIIIYFHNLKYDWSLFEGTIPILSKCSKGGNLYQIVTNKRCLRKGKVWNEYEIAKKKINNDKEKLKELYKEYFVTKKIFLRDSYKIITTSLKNFNETLDLPKHLYKKEAMPYEAYNTHSLNQNSMQIDSVVNKYLKEKDKNQFIKNLKEGKFFAGKRCNNFRHIDYMKHYLKFDVNVLKYGMIKFNKLITDEITDEKITFKLMNKSIYNFLTIGSIAQHITERSGAFDGTHYLKRNLMNFCQSAVRGGRVCLKDNEKQKITKKEYGSYIQDYDCVSCYASSMKRISDELGFPAGKIKYIKNISYDKISKLKYYLVEIEVLSINKKQQIPLYSEVRTVKEGGKQTSRRTYLNEVSKDQRIHVVDKITLEDWIEHHEIEFKLIQGIYFTEFNKKIGELITKLFNLRLKAKKNNNSSMSTILKLIMNAIYGKTLTKQTNERSVYMDCKRLENYRNKYYNSIKSYEEIYSNGKYKQYEVKLNKIDFLYKNRCHIGGLILSMSKRIMNEVICLANDFSIPIFYTDTDSMHLLENDIPKLEKEFKKKYNKNIGGKNLGQFHIDFNIDKCFDVKSKYFCAVGPKTYYDRLVGIELKTGNKKKDDHIRMKGVRKCAIFNKKNKEYEEGGIKQMYQDLYEGKEIEFDNACDKFTPMFKFKKKEKEIKTLKSGDPGTLKTIKF